MKNIERIKTMSEKELIELFHEIPFDCADQCPDFGCGCLETCTHDCGREFIRNWLNAENQDFVEVLSMDCPYCDYVHDCTEDCEECEIYDDYLDDINDLYQDLEE